MPDVGYDGQQRSYAEAIAAFCAAHTSAWSSPSSATEWDDVTWTGLGELGVLGLTAPDSGAEALDVVAAHEALGAGGAAGPLWATALLAGVLDGDEGDGLASGALIGTVGDPVRMPWAHKAHLIFDGTDLGPDGGSLVRCDTNSPGPAVVLLGFEPAAAVSLLASDPIAATPAALGLADLALAAYLAGAARRVITDVSAYVRTRKQFKRTLSQFQAVAHPLAQCDARASAAAALVRRAAVRHQETPTPVDCGLAMASAARAARTAVYQAHQSYGGIGFAEEGPLSWLGSRVGQLSVQAEARWRTRSLAAVLGRRGGGSGPPSAGPCGSRHRGGSSPR